MLNLGNLVAAINMISLTFMLSFYDFRRHILISIMFFIRLLLLKCVYKWQQKTFGKISPSKARYLLYMNSGFKGLFKITPVHRLAQINRLDGSRKKFCIYNA